MKTHILKSALFLLPLAFALPAFAQPGDATMPSAAAGMTDHSDKSFAEKLAEGSTNEVALSQLADSHTSNEDVKAFAQMMVGDHTKLNTQLSDLAMKKGVDLQEAVTKGQTKGVASLEKKTGADFDKAYIKEMVKGHKGAAELLKKEAADSKDGDFSQFAIQALPTVTEHLQKAEALEKTLD